MKEPLFGRAPELYELLDRYESNGFSAYAAGGAVRDALLGRETADYDIATSALPEETAKLFSDCKVIGTGIKHGTVTAVFRGISFEITTYRSDNGYSDNRHPDGVVFLGDIEGDLARRDFTVNAMALSLRGEITDPFGGEGDLKAKIIKCVGDPEKRFCEDALRMLRAVRFRAELDFEIDGETEQAIRKYAATIRKVSSERVLEELNKILLSPHPDYISELHRLGLLRYIIPELERCFGEPQKNKYHIYDVGEHIMHAISYTPRDLELRWAALLHDIGKPCCPSKDARGMIHFYGHHRESRRIAVDLLHRLHMDSDTIKNISILVENHDYRVEPDPTQVKRMMSKTGPELFEKLLILQKADNKAKNPKYYPEKKRSIESSLDIYREVLATHQPYRVSDLVINGRDLMGLGYKQGRSIGDALRRMLEEVIIKPELNERKYLLHRAKELR